MATKKSPEKPQQEEKSQFDRAPRQKNTDREPVKRAEETKDIPTQHGTLK